MAEHSFTVDFRGVRFDVCVGVDPDDIHSWVLRSARPQDDDTGVLRSARPQDDDTDWAGFLMADNHTCAEFDRLCDIEMDDYRAGQVDDVMDRVRDEKMVGGAL